MGTYRARGQLGKAPALRPVREPSTPALTRPPAIPTPPSTPGCFIKRPPLLPPQSPQLRPGILGRKGAGLDASATSPTSWLSRRPLLPSLELGSWSARGSECPAMEASSLATLLPQQDAGQAEARVKRSPRTIVFITTT